MVGSGLGSLMLKADSCFSRGVGGVLSIDGATLILEEGSILGAALLCKHVGGLSAFVREDFLDSMG